MEYIVKFTDKSKTPVTVFENNIDTISTDIALPGRKKLEYGQDLNANFLHLLENFACPEQPNFLPTSPDFTKISDKDSQGRKLLSNPIEGQLWFNTTQETLFVFDGADWLALGMAGDIAANWGVIADGETIPQPKNKSGYIFPYNECSWIVSPLKIEGGFRYMQCFTDENAKVTMQYTPDSSGATPVSGCATYMIVGIKGNVNKGTLQPIPDPTPLPSKTPTPTPSVTRTIQPSITASVTPTPGVSATGTPVVTPTKTPGVSVTPTPSALVYSASITSSPSGQVAPGQNICYMIQLNHPAPASGFTFNLIRSGNTSNVCASTNGETNGPVIETIPVNFTSGQQTTQICRTAPAALPPPPTPTATPRHACLIAVTAAQGGAGGSTAFLIGQAYSNSSSTPPPEGVIHYFKNTCNNFNQCTQCTACNGVMSMSSTQTFSVNSNNGGYNYNGTPAVNLRFQIAIPGVGVALYSRMIASNTARTEVDTASIGNRSFTVTLSMNPVLVNSNGNNRTYTVYAEYTVMDNSTNSMLTWC